MKRSNTITGLAMACLLTAPAYVSAAPVSVFDNGGFVDTDGGIGAESDEIQASLTSLGHTVTTFTSFDAAAWTGAFAGGSVVVIPELQDNLLGAMDAAAQTALASGVMGGGGLIISASLFGDTLTLLNSVFGFSLTSGGFANPWTLNAGNAAGTAFADGPASLPDNNTVASVLTTSIPAGGLSLYESGARTSVFTIAVGAGSITYLGWDWFSSLPAPGSADGGWNAVLDSAVTTAASAVPEPSILGLMALGMLGLGLGRRKAA